MEINAWFNDDKEKKMMADGRTAELDMCYTAPQTGHLDAYFTLKRDKFGN